MIACNSADARTALMASYFSRYPHLQASAIAKAIFSRTPLCQRNVNIPDAVSQEQKPEADTPFCAEGSSRLVFQGRTIYNASIAPAITPMCTKVDSDSKQEGVQKPRSMTALEELERIDAEERRREEQYVHLTKLANRGLNATSKCSGLVSEHDWSSSVGDGASYSGSATGTGLQTSDADDVMAQEMFERYIKVEECMEGCRV
ncbi:hypothetical protein ID866_7008 [Astraeus odoratus]|nr:hypothetical protein ID866_7008 [Astraeus odoratus]